MKPFCALCATALLALTACSDAAEDTRPATSEAEEFAARINGETPPTATAEAASAEAAPPIAAPTVAEPLENVQTSDYAPGTATDPKAACNANRFGEFIGRQPDAEARAEIMEAAADIAEVRFIAPGGEYIKPDPTHPRLNVMIAVDGIIRDIRCG
ncbi:MAG: hypothetical protein QNI87_03035 [Erythrobacter sp.]|uniref:hypothetical protein n=1 Tax=Erythrobacter sp. TaxID=1042 RepID=UPI0026167C64|nr:hypothetical protein [Erythrobacter sp.]MDJ0977485.1 hypothetical protein [Erythrobacter sp.]